MAVKNTYHFLYINVKQRFLKSILEICIETNIPVWKLEMFGLKKVNATLTQSINQTKAVTIWGHVCGAPTVYMELFDKGKGYLQGKRKYF